jgi:hypothetical protein
MENDLRIVGFVGLAILQERLVYSVGAVTMNLIRVCRCRQFILDTQFDPLAVARR